MRNMGTECDSLDPWYMVWLTAQASLHCPLFVNSVAMITGTAM
jgi:hypothetical protein